MCTHAGSQVKGMFCYGTQSKIFLISCSNCKNSFQKRPVPAEGKAMWIKSSAEETGCRQNKEQGVQTQETTSSFSIKMWEPDGQGPHLLYSLYGFINMGLNIEINF